jgi:hypothetical protein
MACHLRKVDVRLDDLDLRLLHRSAERVIEDRELRPGQLHPAADQEQHHEEEEDQLHRGKGSRGLQGFNVGSAPRSAPAFEHRPGTGSIGLPTTGTRCRGTG